MSIISSITHLARQYRTARSRYLTERLIGDLPMELRKDIGWPDAGNGATRGTQGSRPWMLLG